MGETPLQRLRQRAKDLGTKAIGEILNAEGPAEVLGVAVKSVQEGRRLLDEGGGRALNALGLATQADLERVTRKVARLRKRLEALVDVMDEDDA